MTILLMTVLLMIVLLVTVLLTIVWMATVDTGVDRKGSPFGHYPVWRSV